MKSVLIVDDEQAFLLALDLALKDEGYDVQTASTGEDAVALLAQRRPDLILLDIMMPGMGGLETLKILKSHPDYKRIPVVLMSGSRPFVSQDEYRWSAFLNKPFALDELLTTIKRQIGEPLT